MFDVTTGPVSRPQRTVIYGPEGVGKSTFASMWPSPVFIDTEDGTDALDVARTLATDWDDLLSLVRDFAADPRPYGTLVIDTADGAEALCRRHVLARDKKKSIEDYGYGKGYVHALEEWQAMLALLNDVIAAPHPANVVVVAHAQVRKYELPEESQAFDKWELKLDRRIAAATKEWADAVLFLNYKTFVVENASGHGKGRGKERTLYAEHAATYDAKNRWGLPEEAKLDEAWGLIRPHVAINGSPADGARAAAEAERVAAPKPEPRPAPDPTIPAPEGGARGELARLMAEAGLDDPAIRAAMADKGYRPYECPISDYPDQLVEWMASEAVWPSLADYARNNPNPF